MRKAIASLALSCVMVVAASVGSSACEYKTQASNTSTTADQTAQAQPQPASSSD